MLKVENYRIIKITSSRLTAALGREVGRSFAKGEWLLFLDGDMLLFKNFLRIALAYLTPKVNEGIIGVVGDRIDVYTNIKLLVYLNSHGNYKMIVQLLLLVEDS